MNKEDDFREWFKKAESDLIVAKASSELPMQYRDL